MSEKWYEEMQEKAAHNRDGKTDFSNTRAFNYVEEHDKRVNKILSDLSVALEKREAEEYNSRIQEETKKYKENLRKDNIKARGSKDWNNKSERDAFKSMLDDIDDKRPKAKRTSIQIGQI